MDTDLPEPYKSVELLPFDPGGWYINSVQMETLFNKNKIDLAVEVGCWLGLSTRHIASLLPPHGKIYGVDHWKGSVEHQHLQILPILYHQFLSNVIHARLTDKIVPMRMSSLEAALQLKSIGAIPDLIYIDASHDTKSVYADLNAWFPFVQGHGILCGDDWRWSNVSLAVEIFAYKHQLTIHASENFWYLTESGLVTIHHSPL
jgi:predicted O-methyltransferase YrrM